MRGDPRLSSMSMSALSMSSVQLLMMVCVVLMMISIMLLMMMRRSVHPHPEPEMLLVLRLGEVCLVREVGVGVDARPSLYPSLNPHVYADADVRLLLVLVLRLLEPPACERRG